MKKSIKLILCIIVMGMMLFLANYVKAATSSISVNPSEVKVGDTVTITVTVNAAQWNLTLTADGKNIDSWTETVNYKENLSRTFKAFYKATQKGTVKFVLSGDITDVNQDNKEINTSKSVTVTEKTTSGNSNGGNTSSSGSNNTGSNSSSNNTKPTFTNASRTVYTTGNVNLRSSWSTSSAATQVEKGTELKLTGTSNQRINGYIWYRVEYKGVTKYIASNLITNTKPAEEEPDEKEEEEKKNNNLSSLTIQGITLTPSFSANVTQYTATVGKDVNDIEIEAKAQSTNAKVSIEGNKNLKDGENSVKIVVTAQDNTKKTYTIIVTKGQEIMPEEPSNNEELRLSDLKIVGVNFENGFDPTKFSYELTLNVAIKNLTITAVPNQSDAKVEILGNNDFKQGENLVTILLTSSDGTQKASYQIKVTMSSDIVETKTNLQVYLIYGGGAIAAIILILIIVNLLKRKSSRNDYKDLKEDLPKDLDNTIEASKKVTIDDFLDTSELEEEEKNKSRHSKGGRHSL